LFTSIINAIVCGNIPDEVARFLASTVVVPIPKSETDIRPVNMCTIYRKIASMYLFKMVMNDEEVLDYLGDYQFALKKGGMEDIVHSLRFASAERPECDTFLIDAKNAFNSINRRVGLWNIMKEAPYMFPLMNAMYGKESDVVYVHRDEKGKATDTVRVPSTQGFHQGDVLGTWAYVMTLQLLLLEIKKKVSEYVVNQRMAGREIDNQILSLFYVDDGNLCGNHELMMIVIDYLNTTGKNLGFVINPNKGAYLMGKVNDEEEYQNRLGAVVQRGIDPAIVKRYPEDGSSEEAKSEYGAKVHWEKPGC
jgi:hypothetical protein